MPFINLIAEQRQQMRDRVNKTRTWFMAFLTIAGLSVVLVGSLFVRAETLKAEVRNLDAKGMQLKPIKEEIARSERMLAELRPRLETLGTARHDTARWTRILDHISLVMPPETWLTGVTAQPPSDPAKQVEVAWTGMSTEQNLVGELMMRLQRCEDLDNVQLKFTEQKRTSNGVGIEFQIASEVIGTAEEKPKKTVKS